MNRSYSKIRHMQESNLRLERRLISERVIKEDEDMDQGMTQGCTTLKICKGKTFKANSLDRLSELYRFIFNFGKFKQVKYGVDNVYPPALAPSNSPYDTGTYVAWEYVNSTAKKKYYVRVSQMNECIKSCPQIMINYDGREFGSSRYSILDDVEFQRLKTEIKKAFLTVRDADDID